MSSRKKSDEVYGLAPFAATSNIFAIPVKALRSIIGFEAERSAGSSNPSMHFEQHVLATYNFLEAARKSSQLSLLVFTST